MPLTYTYEEYTPTKSWGHWMSHLAVRALAQFIRVENGTWSTPAEFKSLIAEGQQWTVIWKFEKAKVIEEDDGTTVNPPDWRGGIRITLQIRNHNNNLVSINPGDINANGDPATQLSWTAGDQYHGHGGDELDEKLNNQMMKMFAQVYGATI